MVRPLVFMLPQAILFWAVWFWSFMPEYKIVQRAREEARHEDSRDAGSVRVIMLGNWIGLLLALFLAFTPIGQFPDWLRSDAYYLGVAMMIAGSLLRRRCWRELGKHFTGDVKAAADQPVIQTGPYRWVRHPSYTAGMLMFVGIGVALTNWLSIAVVLAISAAAYSYRVRVEERALLAEIGQPYADFMRTRKRFIPFVV
jgi:protein-S-isoprenylcysteine O-methyltransferase Ste14